MARRFYPADLPPKRMARILCPLFPGRRRSIPLFTAPRGERPSRRWMEMTPAAFRFACKLPARDHPCSPAARLPRRVELHFFRAIEAARAETAGHPDPAPALVHAEGRQNGASANFSSNCRADFRFAIEFRHPGWHRPQIIRLLEKHRVCWVWADTSPLNERNLAPFEFLPRTTDFLYLRLLGDYARNTIATAEHLHRYGKLLWKREAALESWSLEIERHLAEMRSVWAFVNNHFEGFAPETCQRLAQRLGFDLAAASRGSDFADRATRLFERRHSSTLVNCKPAPDLSDLSALILRFLHPRDWLAL